MCKTPEYMYVYMQYLYFRCKMFKLPAHMDAAALSYGRTSRSRVAPGAAGRERGGCASPRHVAACAEVRHRHSSGLHGSPRPQSLASHFESKTENRVTSQASPRCRRPGRGSCPSPGNSRTCLHRAVVCLLSPAGPGYPSRAGGRPGTSCLPEQRQLCACRGLWPRVPKGLLVTLSRDRACHQRAQTSESRAGTRGPCSSPRQTVHSV